jgi:23S rRNA-/tRNA-specific pseudouridylate synthase
MVDPARERCFVVSGDSVALTNVVDKLAPGDIHALDEGRIFVDGKRVEEGQTHVQSGSRVTWYAPRSNSLEVDDVEFCILDRRDDFVIVAKPALWLSEPDRTGHRVSVRERAASFLHERNLHVATRLDFGVSGLMLAVLGPSARKEAVRLQNLRQIKKDYLALMLGTVAEKAHWDRSVDGKLDAITTGYRLGVSELVRFSPPKQSAASQLLVNPVTGRYHQIRIHAAAYGHPILGDRRYGGPIRYVKAEGAVRKVPRPMLHAWRLTIPWHGQPWTTICPVPNDMRKLWAELGGSETWPNP